VWGVGYIFWSLGLPMMAYWNLSKKKYFDMMMVILDLAHFRGAQRFAWNIPHRAWHDKSTKIRPDLTFTLTQTMPL
jgi:hypothetical protein